MRPGAATSTAASIPRGIASDRRTSSTMGTITSRRLPTSTASSRQRTAARTWTPRADAVLIAALTSSKSLPGPATTMTSRPGDTSSRSSTDVVTPIPMPSPPGVLGSWPIIVDSVMMVSVIVSIASPLMTGVASLTRISRTSAGSTCDRRSTFATTWATPTAFLAVPFTPVVGVRDPCCQSTPSGPILVTAASVVELPMSTPMTTWWSPMLTQLPGGCRSPPPRASCPQRRARSP